MTAQICPTCRGKGTVVKNGPSEWEYDNQYPCPTCTTDRTALKGTGYVTALPRRDQEIDRTYGGERK